MVEGFFILFIYLFYTIVVYWIMKVRHAPDWGQASCNTKAFFWLRIAVKCNLSKEQFLNMCGILPL